MKTLKTIGKVAKNIAFLIAVAIWEQTRWTAPARIIDWLSPVWYEYDPQSPYNTTHIHIPSGAGTWIYPGTWDLDEILHMFPHAEELD